MPESDKQALVSGGLEKESLLPADVHDITEEGSDMTRDIFFAILKDTQDGPPRPKSLPDQSDILHEDIGASRWIQFGTLVVVNARFVSMILTDN